MRKAKPLVALALLLGLALGLGDGAQRPPLRQGQRALVSLGGRRPPRRPSLRRDAARRQAGGRARAHVQRRPLRMAALRPEPRRQGSLRLRVRLPRPRVLAGAPGVRPARGGRRSGRQGWRGLGARKVVVMGASLGGIAAIVAAANVKPPLDGVAAISAPRRSRGASTHSRRPRGSVFRRCTSRLSRTRTTRTTSPPTLNASSRRPARPTSASSWCPGRCTASSW